MSRLGWGIIGIGNIVNERIAPALAAEENSSLIAAVSREQARADEFAMRFDAEYAYDDYDEMLANDAVEAVFIATPNALHADQVVAAARAKKHVLCDKPLALTAQDARACLEACRQNGVELGVNFHYRHMPWVHDVTKAVADGRLGQIQTIQLEIGSGPRTYQNWRSDKELTGLGSVTNVGVHGIDVLRVVLDSEPVEVVAMFDNHPDSGSVEWLALLTLRFANGTLVQVNCNESVANPRNDIAIYGTKARLVGRGLTRSRDTGSLELTDGSQTTIESYPLVNAHHLAVAAYTDAILSGATPNASGFDGLRSVELCEAILRSAVDGRVARVRYS